MKTLPVETIEIKIIYLNFTVLAFFLFTDGFALGLFIFGSIASIIVIYLRNNDR